MMKVINSWINDFTDKFKKEKDVRWSEQESAFLMTDEVYKALDKKYDFKKLYENTDANIVMYETFRDFLEIHFEQVVIKVELPWMVNGEMYIDIGEQIDTVMDLYNEIDSPSVAKESYENLFNSADWGITLDRDVKVFIFGLLKDTLTDTLDDMIKSF